MYLHHKLYLSPASGRSRVCPVTRADLNFMLTMIQTERENERKAMTVGREELLEELEMEDVTCVLYWCRQEFLSVLYMIEPLTCKNTMTYCRSISSTYCTITITHCYFLQPIFCTNCQKVCLVGHKQSELLPHASVSLTLDRKCWSEQSTHYNSAIFRALAQLCKCPGNQPFSSWRIQCADRHASIRLVLKDRPWVNQNPNQSPFTSILYLVCTSLLLTLSLILSLSQQHPIYLQSQSAARLRAGSQILYYIYDHLIYHFAIISSSW